ncbi:hypothetical protein [Roseovarius sp. 2305UL8-3]
MLKTANFMIQFALAGLCVAPLLGVPIVACAIASGLLTLIAALLAIFG